MLHPHFDQWRVTPRNVDKRSLIFFAVFLHLAIYPPNVWGTTHGLATVARMFSKSRLNLAKIWWAVPPSPSLRCRLEEVGVVRCKSPAVWRGVVIGIESPPPRATLWKNQMNKNLRRSKPG